MDYFKISKFTEHDFNAIIESIGGSRFSQDDSREDVLNCDYELNDSLIELKLIEEGIVDKITKRDKLAKLFGSRYKTVILAPERLSEKEKNQYYRILETPIKTALKKASKQLQEASKKKKYSVKIAIIINNGLSLMMPDEFEQVAIKCATNDTSGIDILLTGGNYFFSDKLDAYTVFPLKELYLNGIYRSDIVDSIRSGWSEFLIQFMNNHIFDEKIEGNKEPLQDISFYLNGILYVKPPPKMEITSTFFSNGTRPREDSTELTSCPPVAIVLPKLDKQGYDIAEKSIEDTWSLHGDFQHYLDWVSLETNKTTSLTQPLVSIEIPSEKANADSFQQLCSIATEVFNMEINKIINSISEFTNKHQSLNYILLTCVEIGIDKANDISFIEHINECTDLVKKITIIEGERLKFEYACALASSYCIKFGADCVYYVREDTYKWV